ncbi:hypothetical protein NC651_015169 [Populus alba x Populus x berolinensis]|nr:hypothetical protein NC651_015169 [Populus alba x Populus x berolinensis]
MSAKIGRYFEHKNTTAIATWSADGRGGASVFQDTLEYSCCNGCSLCHPSKHSSGLVHNIPLKSWMLPSSFWI